MAFYDKFPYTNFQEINLDRIIQELRKVENDLQFVVENASLKYADPIEWNITTQYQANTVVIDPATGIAYISTKPVPANILVTDTNYWTKIFDLSTFFEDTDEQIQALQTAIDTINGDIVTINNNITSLDGKIDREVDDLETRIDTEVAALNTRIDNAFDNLPRIFVKLYGAEGDGVTDDTAAIQQCIDENPNCQIVFTGKYLISDTIKVPTAYGTVLNLTGSELKANAAITMVEFSTSYNPLNYSTVSQFYGITGGVIDGNNIATIGVKNHDNRGIYTNLKIIDFTDVGFYDNYNDDTIAGQTFISNVSIMMQRYSADWSEGRAVGLVLNGQDCRISNLAIMRMNIGIRVQKTGTLFSNIYIYGQLNTTKYPAYDFSNYVSKGFQLEQDITYVKLPHLANNLYFDTLHYGVYNSGGTGHNFICNNVQMYSDNVGFNNTPRELYLVGGKPMSCTFNNINCYDNEYSIFVKGEYNTGSLVESNYSIFNVSHNPNYLADKVYSLNNLGHGRRYLHANMTQYTNYKIGELATLSSNGIGAWKISGRVAGVEDIEAVVSSFGGPNGIKVTQTNNRIGNTTIMFRVGTTLKMRTLQNNTTYYYYELFVTTLNASENIWIESDIEGLVPHSTGYMFTYYDPLPTAANAGTTIDVPIESGLKTYDIASGNVIATTISSEAIGTFLRGAVQIASFRNNSFTVNANSEASITFNTSADLTGKTILGLLTQFIDAGGLAIEYCQQVEDRVVCRIRNLTGSNITTNGAIYYTYF